MHSLPPFQLEAPSVSRFSSRQIMYAKIALAFAHKVAARFYFRVAAELAVTVPNKTFFSKILSGSSAATTLF
jgi:hypothetical protein